MRYGYCANGFRFDSHLADFRFVLFFFTFFQAYKIPLGVSVRLGLRLGLGFNAINHKFSNCEAPSHGRGFPKRTKITDI